MYSVNYLSIQFILHGTQRELKFSKTNHLTKLATVNSPPHRFLYRQWTAIKSSRSEKAGIISLVIKLHSVIYFSTSLNHLHNVVIVIHNFVFFFVIIYAHVLLLKVWTAGRWYECFCHWTYRTPKYSEQCGRIILCVLWLWYKQTSQLVSITSLWLCI